MSSRAVYSGGNYGRSSLIENGYQYYTYDRTNKLRIRCYGLRPPADYNYIFEEQLYNLQDNSKATKDLLDEQEDITLELKEKLSALKESFPVADGAGSSVKVDSRTKKQLESIGYVDK